MRNISIIYKIIFVAVLSMAFASAVNAQSEYQPYNYQFYQKLNSDFYSTRTREHTSIRPLIIDSVLKAHYDSLMNYGGGGKQHTALYNKLFNGHMIDCKGSNSTFYTDLLPDFDIGRDFTGKLTTNTTSLGLQIGGTAGNKFYYNVAGWT